MPLQHVLDTARRLGIPVVITDEAGDAAQVVMPFDDFAAMVGASSPAPKRKPRAVPPPPASPSPTREPISDEIAEALADIQFEGIREEPFTRDDVAKAPPPSDDGFLEEKFYLEPLDDEESLK